MSLKLQGGSVLTKGFNWVKRVFDSIRKEIKSFNEAETDLQMEILRNEAKERAAKNAAKAAKKNNVSAMH
jgi:hypothetical protein